MVAEIAWLPEEEHVAPVIDPPPLLLEDDELLELELELDELELLLELDDPVPPYEQ
jgi:hypothetical protein